MLCYICREQTIRQFILLTMCLLFIQQCHNNQTNNDKLTKKHFAAKLEQSLHDEVLDLWYPLAIDTVDGGYLTNFSRDWKPDKKQNKMLVVQARHIWSLSEVAQTFPEYKDTYRKAAEMGVQFIKNHMWDDVHGGFYSLVTKTGEVTRTGNSFTDAKNSYSNSFAIYGLTNYYQVFGDENALDLAKRTFRWLENHAYDDQYGGYYMYLERDGTPIKERFMGEPPKDQNSSIHLMEAFTELYKVWPNDTVKTRLHEMLTLIRDTMVVKNQYLTLFFEKNWDPVSYRDSLKNKKAQFFNHDHVSFGHDIETAYLMIEAAKAMDIDLEPNLKVAKSMVDHSIKQGWDTKNGGIYDAGYYPSEESELEIVKSTKIWWSQAEALNTFIYMDKLYPEDEMNYYNYAVKEWQYIQKYIIDEQYGGWFWSGIDVEPDSKDRPKANIWKATYHNTRALVNAINMLKGEASLKPVKMD